jgi:hypothetical protein
VRQEQAPPRPSGCSAKAARPNHAKHASAAKAPDDGQGIDPSMRATETLSARGSVLTGADRNVPVTFMPSLKRDQTRLAAGDINTTLAQKGLSDRSGTGGDTVAQASRSERSGAKPLARGLTVQKWSRSKGDEGEAIAPASSQFVPTP